MEKEQDWLFPDREKQKKQQEDNALSFAQNYLVFEQDPRGKALLEMWLSASRAKKIPVNSPATEYAAENALREFFEGILTQIKLANNRGLMPHKGR